VRWNQTERTKYFIKVILTAGIVYEKGGVLLPYQLINMHETRMFETAANRLLLELRLKPDK
jgi:hypothetical protein